MATLSEVWAMIQMPTGVAAFLLLMRLAPFVIERTRATVQSLEGLLLDCGSLARTARKMIGPRKRRAKSARSRSPKRNPDPSGPLRSGR